MRTPATFRTSHAVSFTATLRLRDHLRVYATRHGLSPAEVVRNAIVKYAHEAAHLSVPPEYQPRHPDHLHQPESLLVNISTTINSDGLRREYEAHAKDNGITISQLILRCVCAQMLVDSVSPLTKELD